jgi:hypothetical protein
MINKSEHTGVQSDFKIMIHFFYEHIYKAYKLQYLRISTIIAGTISERRQQCYSGIPLSASV